MFEVVVFFEEVGGEEVDGLLEFVGVEEVSDGDFEEGGEAGKYCFFWDSLFSEVA